MVLVEYWGFGVRHVQLLLLVICGAVAAILMQTLDVAIHMVEINLKTNNFTLFDDEFRSHIRQYTFEQRFILKNSGTVGRFFGSLVGGVYARHGDRRKLKYFLLIDFAIMSVHSYLIPIASINMGFDFVFWMMLFQGYLYGPILPLMIAILARWTPSQEVGRTCTLVLSSRHLGFLIIYILGLFLRTSIGGWRTLFYIVGNFGLLWCVAWFTFGFQDPKGCFYLSEREKEFIHDNITNVPPITSVRKQTPWGNILSSMPVYASLIAQVSYGWFYEILIQSSLVVDYLHYHEHVDLELTKCIQYMVPAGMIIVEFVAALAVDTIYMKQKFPITFIRKTCNSIGSWGMSLALLWLCYNPKGEIEILFIIILQYTNVFVNLGSKLVIYDITREYSGLLDGLFRFVITLPMAFYIPIMRPLLPISTDNCTEEECEMRSLRHFSIMWYTGAGTSLIGNFVFIVSKTRDKILRSDRMPKTKRTSIFDVN